MDGVVQGWVRQATANQLVVNERDGSVLVYVPPGEFEMGDDYRFIDWASGESCCDCPKHRVWLDGYYIGIYAVTNAQYLAFVEAKGHRTPDRVELPPMLRAMVRESWKPVWKGRSFPPEKANHPVVCVSWKDAQAYAKWAGLILPTEAQWERAVRGPENLAYPWGDISDADGCRENRDSGSEGHVREWCEDWYHAVYYSTQPASFQFQNPRGPKKGLNRVIRGGAFSCPASRRGYLDPDYGHDNLGFRLARAV